MKKKVLKKKITLHSVSFILNGENVTCEIKSSDVLLDVLRNIFDLKGTKPGCNEGECGACTVLVNGAPVNSCLFLAINAKDKNIQTIEGLAKENGTLNIVQNALVNNGAVQCGFCTSGMAMSLQALLNKYEQSHHVPGEFANETPGREDIKKWLEGNLCRCTGYVKIIDAAESLFSKEE